MLKELIAQMLEEANKQMEKPITRKLKNNLHLTLTAHPNSLDFEISRDTVYPSTSEWKTCLKYFPYFVGDPAPQQHAGSRFKLGATLPQKKTIQMF